MTGNWGSILLLLLDRRKSKSIQQRNSRQTELESAIVKRGRALSGK
jgi:hypothetical protein